MTMSETYDSGNNRGVLKVAFKDYFARENEFLI